MTDEIKIAYEKAKTDISNLISFLKCEIKKEPMFINAMITPKYKKYKFGPFVAEPSKMQFNSPLFMEAVQQVI